MSERKKMAKKPPSESIRSVQYDLFSQFVSNDKAEVSNTVEMWERIPKYFLTPKQVEKLRTEDGLAKPYKLEYTEKDQQGRPHNCAVVIQPALIESDGTYKAYFPSSTEEIIEEALKKILSDQKYGLHDQQNVETWVRFSLSLLHRELKARGRERNRNEIKHAIAVMSKCNIAFFRDGKELWNGSILQDLVTVGRDDYLDEPDAQHITRLPLFISRAINKLEFRQFNYDRLLQCNGQLTRWIYKRLIHRYKQASAMNTYHFMYSELKGSGLLQQARERDNRKKANEALTELVKKGVLSHFEVDERKNGRTIEDIKYTVTATPEFGKEQAAAHKRANDSRLFALNYGCEL